MRLVMDISDWQEGLNYDAAKAEGVTGAIVKLTERTRQQDVAFTHINECLARGMNIGVYCFSRAQSPWEAQGEAEAIINIMKQGNIIPTLGVWYDLESEENKLAQDLTAVASKFISTLNASGYMAGIYANWDFYNNRLDINQLADYVPYWLADLSGDPSDFVNRFPNKKLHGLQYSWAHNIDGMNVDMNYWYE